MAKQKIERIPRKKKKLIPKDTFYCYDYRGCCPFWNYLNNIDGYCSLIKTEVLDQVKECGERYHKF